jgi:hypothetical protein
MTWWVCGCDTQREAEAVSEAVTYLRLEAQSLSQAATALEDGVVSILSLSSASLSAYSPLWPIKCEPVSIFPL